ncbi:MAG: hypothetical protein D6681_14585 [Calditrichaeota bacterium]|nr:MAG: hypothetical protein D6681_14585 [Calditrichota bacterium]
MLTLPKKAVWLPDTFLRVSLRVPAGVSNSPVEPSFPPQRDSSLPPVAQNDTGMVKQSSIFMTFIIKKQEEYHLPKGGFWFMI